MIDYQRLFHVGVRVPDLGAAMDEIGHSMGVTWAEHSREPGPEPAGPRTADSRRST